MVTAIELRAAADRGALVSYSGSRAGDGERQDDAACAETSPVVNASLYLHHFGRSHVIDNNQRHLCLASTPPPTDIDSTTERWTMLGHQAADRLDGWMFYGLEAVHPRQAVFSQCGLTTPDDSAYRRCGSSRGRSCTETGLKLIARWLIEVAVEDPQKLQRPQNIDELAIEAELFLRKQIKWAPKDIKAIRARILELLTPVRR